jgi:hypothetical protein
LKDLVDFSLTEINQPLSFIPKTPLVTPPTSTHSDIEIYESEEADSNSENSDNESDNMENNNEEIPEGNDQPTKTNHGWLGMPWPYQDDYTIFLGTQRNFSQNMILETSGLP